MCTPCSRPWDLPTLIRSNWVHTTSLPREIWRVGKARGNLQRLSTRGQSCLQDCKLNRVAVLPPSARSMAHRRIVSMILHTEERLVTGRAATVPPLFLHCRIVRNNIHRVFHSPCVLFFFFFLLYLHRVGRAGMVEQF